MTPACKISDEAHAVRMAKRTRKRLKLAGSYRRAPDIRKGGPPFNDGFDKVRLDRAAQKARTRAAKRT